MLLARPPQRRRASARYSTGLSGRPFESQLVFKNTEIWDADSYELISEHELGNTVRAIAVSPDGGRLVAGDRKGGIFVFDTDSHETVLHAIQVSSIFGIDYSSSGKMISTVGSDKIVRVWEATKLKSRQQLSGHDGPIYSTRFANAGPLLATVGWNNNIHVWNVEIGETVKSLAGVGGDVWGVCFAKDNRRLFTAGQEATATIWNLETGNAVVTFKGHVSAAHNVALSQDNRRMATSSRDETIRVWKVDTITTNKKVETF